MNRWKLLILCLSVLVIISFSVRQDHFKEVIDRQSNEKIKSKLLDFKRKGIEKSVNTKKYNADKIISDAMGFLNTPHRMGGTSAKGMDCSGLVMVVHQSQEITLPHSSQEQARYGSIIPFSDQLKPGDLVFFYDSYKTSNFITHSGIYIGNEDFIHTSNSKGVMISKINDPSYWGPRFLFGTRLK